MAVTRNPEIEEGDVRWWSVALVIITLVGTTALRTSFGPLQEASQVDLGLSDLQIGLIQGLGTGGAVALLALPASWLIDHGNRRRLLIALAFSGLAGTLATALSQDFWTLLLARLLSSFGPLTAISVAISLCSDLAPPQRRAPVLLLLAIGIWAGVALAFGVGASAIGHFAAVAPEASALVPWRKAQIVAAVCGLLLILPALLLREPARREVAHRGASVWITLRGMQARWGFLAALLVGQLGVVTADSAATVWATPILIRNYGLEPADFAGWMTIVILVAGVGGSILGGLGAALGQRARRPGGIMYAAALAAVIAIPAALFCIMPNLPSFAALFALLLICGTVTDLSCAIAVAVLIPNEERGACLSLFAVAKALIGVTLAPILVTLGSDVLGGREHIAVSLAIVGAVTGIVAAASYLISIRLAPAPLIDPTK